MYSMCCMNWPWNILYVLYNWPWNVLNVLYELALKYTDVLYNWPWNVLYVLYELTLKWWSLSSMSWQAPPGSALPWCSCCSRIQAVGNQEHRLTPHHVHNHLSKNKNILRKNNWYGRYALKFKTFITIFSSICDI